MKWNKQEAAAHSWGASKWPTVYPPRAPSSLWLADWFWFFSSHVLERFKSIPWCCFFIWFLFCFMFFSSGSFNFILWFCSFSSFKYLNLFSKLIKFLQTANVLSNSWTSFKDQTQLSKFVIFRICEIFRYNGFLQIHENFLNRKNNYKMWFFFLKYDIF